MILLTTLSLAAERSLRAEPSSDWQTRAVAELAAREYEISWQDGTPQAPNRAQGLRSRFTETGLRIEPRVGEESGWEWGLTLLRYGRPGAPASALRTPRLAPSRNRVDRDWGGIVEWYVNDARGLEHGFTVAGRPDGATAEVHVELALTGTLDPTFSADGQAIDFRMHDGPYVLRYGGLVVVDARGRQLPARMEGFADAGVRGVRIAFDDSDAVYPVTIDPLATSAAWNGEGNQAAAWFGISVATAGDVNGDGYSDVIVGAEKYDSGQADEGRAFLYLGQPSGLAAASAWTAESNQTSALFGGSVAAAGDLNGDGYADVVVGCRQFDNGQTDAGRAYFYLGGASGLAATAFFIAEGDQTSAFFGSSVATAGDVNGDGYADVVIGAPEYDNGQPDEGRAYLYYGAPSGLIAGWSPEGNQAAALFGGAVATAGDVNGDGFADVLVSARMLDAGQADEGRVYLYFGSSSGLSFVQGWQAESNQAFANFGVSLGTAGDVNGDGYADVIIGSSLYDNGQADEGRVFVYLGSVSGPAVTPSWTAENDQAGAQLGIAVATAGDVNGDGYADVVLGASLWDNGQVDEGRASVYLGGPTGLAATPTWSVETDQANAQFGASVATAADVNGDGFSDVLVGAPLADNGQTDEGRGYLYLGGASGLTANENWAVDVNFNVANLGYSIASAGDVNGDGYSDVIVGAYRYDFHGRAFLYLGAASGLATTAAWTQSGTLGQFGTSVASAGDVNGDGYDDVVIGAPESSPGGKASLYLGSSAGLATSPAWIGTPGQNASKYGISVASAGDVNGDGYADVIVGDDRWDNVEGDEGRVSVYLGSAAGLASSPAWIVESNSELARFGKSVASAGDVNRDGYSDVIVGATDYNYQIDGGRAFVYLGSAAGLSPTAVWTASGGDFGGHYGDTVASAGDVNGDGYSDILVGAWNTRGPGGFVGRVLLYLGSASGPSPTVSTALDSEASITEFGFGVAGAGDVNGDGYSDVVVGAPEHSLRAGKTYLFLGSPSGLNTTPAWTRVGPQMDAKYGWYVASAGDVNGDGFSDVLAGAPQFDNGQSNEGLAFMYYGNGGLGRDYAPRQLRANGTALIQILGKSESSSSFRLFGAVWSPSGRSRVRVQVETKPLGTSFNGAGLQQTGIADTNEPGAAGSRVYFNHLVDGLTTATPYKWRLRALSDSPFFPTSRWISPAGNNRTEADLRTSSCIDLDGDGYGAPGNGACLAGGLADCDDTRAGIYPGAAETCDGFDNNCNGTTDDVPPPVGSPSLLASRAGADVHLSWTSIPNATRYDVVRGALNSLRASGGNFTTAIDQCVSDNGASTSATASGTPAAGDGFFFLTRGTVATCAVGTYDTSSPKQIGSRDAEIAASPSTCP